MMRNYFIRYIIIIVIIFTKKKSFTSTIILSEKKKQKQNKQTNVLIFSLKFAVEFEKKLWNLQRKRQNRPRESKQLFKWYYRKLPIFAWTENAILCATALTNSSLLSLSVLRPPYLFFLYSFLSYSRVSTRSCMSYKSSNVNYVQGRL
jgi:hypothetical protein